MGGVHLIPVRKAKESTGRKLEFSISIIKLQNSFILVKVRERDFANVSDRSLYTV
jgi:hypothetical protein